MLLLAIFLVLFFTVVPLFFTTFFHQAVNDANRVNRQTPDQLLDNEILVADHA